MKQEFSHTKQIGSKPRKSFHPVSCMTRYFARRASGRWSACPAVAMGAVVWLVLLALGLAGLAGVVGPGPVLAVAAPVETAAPAGGSGAAGPELVVHFLDVGQGDATLLQGPGFTILIDAGRHDRADVVPHLEAIGVETIDLFIGTHPHSDHIGQCAAVLRRFPVREVWLTGHEHTTLTYERCLDAILDSEAGYREPRAGETVTLGGARLEVVHPAQLTGDLNNDSIAVRFVYGDVVILFTGDAEAGAETAMVERGLPLQADILHMGHHGSRTSSTEGFLAVVGPRVAIYSAGRDNSYGHPHQEALARVAAVAAFVYGTDVNGTVRVQTDGSTYQVVPERGGPVGATSDLSDAGEPAATETGTGSPSEPALGAACMPGQIDINTASAQELTGLIHVGPVLAERIVALRPFASVADLVQVPGIGASRLADIEAQGMACAAP